MSSRWWRWGFFKGHVDALYSSRSTLHDNFRSVGRKKCILPCQHYE